MELLLQIYTFVVPLLLLKPSPVLAHPQCLDFGPPFKPAEPLKTCSEYSSFTCCSPEQDEKVRSELSDILSRADSRLQATCRNFLQEILCLRCSPYAAHIYEAEDTRVIAPFPGLCRNYCLSFHSYCSAFIPELTTSISLKQADQFRFCDNIQLQDVSYCYPDLLSNQQQETLQINQLTKDGCLCLEEFASNLRNPLIMRAPPDGSGRLIIGEQVGLLHIFYKNGTKLQEPFLNIRHLVLTSSSSGDERGFLGMAFHPDFKSNSKLYVYFSISTSTGHMSRLSEFKVLANDPNKVDPNSEKVLLEVKQPYSNHNGGELLFGVDGYLYLFLGDGGAGGDPYGYAQDKSVLLGKALRLDVDVPAGINASYLIPPDNPFINDPSARSEIFAYGIRNIWRCDVDEGDPKTGYGRGRIICGDVGQNAYEEIDLIVNGGNYGWNIREGFNCYRQRNCDTLEDEELPIYAYPHSVGQSVTGGHVYRGCLNPELNGKYIYGDYVRGRLFTLTEDPVSSTWQNQEISMCGPEFCFNGLVGRYETNILSFGEDDDGEIYMLTTSSASPTSYRGKVYKFIDPRVRGDPTLCRSYKRTVLPGEGTSTTSTPMTTAAPTTTTTTPANPCDSQPCQNGGTCTTSEDPYGWGYVCVCGNRDIGGKLCEFERPCQTRPCPQGSILCFRSAAADNGRFCYSPTWELLD